jgi:hypothetical protein
MKNKGIEFKLMRLLGLVVAIGLMVLPSASVGATPPISGPTIEFEGTTTNVGSHTELVYSVAVGDLDIASGGRDDKVNVWRNDGTPFSDAWNWQEIGSHTSDVESVTVGDLDGDGDLDLVSGGGDFKVYAWQNDGTPFNDTWNSQEVGSHWWSVANSVTVGDLDGDGDLDLVSGGSDDEVNAWQNQGGSAGLAVTDTSPDAILIGTEDDLLKVVFTHNGVAGDRDLELNTSNLDLFRSDCSIPLTSAEANAIVENLRVRLDDGDDVFKTDDTLVADVEALSLAGGVQTVPFTDGDANVQVSATISKTYWISVLTTADASSQSPNQFCLNFDPDADALVEGKSPDPPDFSVSIQDTEPTDTGSVTATGGTIIVEKQTDPAGGTGFGFGGDLGTFTLDDDGSQVFSSLDAGDYDVTEAAPTGWDLDSVVCSGGDSTALEDGVTIHLNSGETITCTFTNVQRGSIIVEKQTDPDGTAGSFTFTGDAAGTISDGQQIVVSDLAPGTYTATEDDPAPAFDLTAIACDDDDSSGDVATRTATFNLDPGEAVTCTFTNTLKLFTLAVDKAGIGMGTVTSDPTGINCGADCIENYVWDTVVTLAATSGANSFFIEWSGDCSGTDPITTVTMDADRTCTATFGYTWKVYLPLITKGTP